MEAANGGGEQEDAGEAAGGVLAVGGEAENKADGVDEGSVDGVLAPPQPSTTVSGRIAQALRMFMIGG